MSETKHDDDEYHSSSDEDYDPEKDIDPQDEIDDADVADDLVENVEELKKEAKSEEKAGSSEEVDVDAIFAELTGQDPSKIKNEGSMSSEEKKEEPKVYPKVYPKAPSDPSPSSSVYPSTKEVEKPVAKPGTKRVGLLDAAKSLSKRSKMSVLERSDRDWKQFTTEQNIKEDLESHNRGKGGYLNKMDFLNRTDNRQFEKERAFRATARKDN